MKLKARVHLQNVRRNVELLYSFMLRKVTRQERELEQARNDNDEQKRHVDSLQTRLSETQERLQEVTDASEVCKHWPSLSAA